MKIIATSDLHGARPDIPECDLFIFAGDATARNTPNEQRRFAEWLREVPAASKIVVAGNHDDIQLYTRNIQPYTHYLLNEGVTVQGLKVWGTPYTPIFMHWNFMAKPDELAEFYKKMPEKLDILITHGPEFGVLDKNVDGEHCGDPVLAKYITKQRPKIHIFGHIHEGFGYTNVTGVHSYNVSYVDQHYEQTRKLVEIKLDKNKRIV